MSEFDKVNYVGTPEFEMLNDGLPYGQEFTFNYVSKAGRASQVRAVPLFPKVFYNLGTGENDESFAMLIINVRFLDGNGRGSGRPKKSASHDYIVASMSDLVPSVTEKGKIYHTLPLEDLLYPQQDYQVRCSVLSIRRITAIDGSEAAEIQAAKEDWKLKAPMFLAGARFVPIETVVRYTREHSA